MNQLKFKTSDFHISIEKMNLKEIRGGFYKANGKEKLLLLLIRSLKPWAFKPRAFHHEKIRASLA